MKQLTNNLISFCNELLCRPFDHMKNLIYWLTGLRIMPNSLGRMRQLPQMKIWKMIKMKLLQKMMRKEQIKKTKNS